MEGLLIWAMLVGIALLPLVLMQVFRMRKTPLTEQERKYNRRHGLRFLIGGPIMCASGFAQARWVEHLQAAYRDAPRFGIDPGPPPSEWLYAIGAVLIFCGVATTFVGVLQFAFPSIFRSQKNKLGLGGAKGEAAPNPPPTDSQPDARPPDA